MANSVYKTLTLLAADNAMPLEAYLQSTYVVGVSVRYAGRLALDGLKALPLGPTLGPENGPATADSTNGEH